MKLTFSINPNIEEETIHISAKAITPQIEKIMALCHQQETDLLTVLKDDRSYLLKVAEITYLVVENEKCLISSNGEIYTFKGTLKSFDENYADVNFMRLSKFCIGNINWIHYFEASFSGGLVVVFKDGHKENVSRKYATDLKKRLLRKKSTQN